MSVGAMRGQRTINPTRPKLRDTSGMTQLRTDPPFRAYKDLLWAEVRRRYGLGESGPGLCREFGLSLSTMRGRAARDGWRRRDDPAPAPPASPVAASQQALRAVEMSVAKGDYAEADKQIAHRRAAEPHGAARLRCNQAAARARRSLPALRGGAA
jgi:hypothetical protein